MSVKGRSSSRMLVYALALPVFALVYVTTFGARLWAALRPSVATFLGVTVIGSVYAETAYRKTPTPMRAAAAVGLAVVLVFPSLAAPATVAAADPAQAVIAAAKQYLGQNFQIGAEGPKVFDCSGLVYRAFSDAGQLPRIGGMRLRAAGYMQYFVARGRFTKDESKAQPGDLVVYAGGEHVGIYLGDDKVISALINPWGVSITHVHSLHLKVSYYLKVNWGGGDGSTTPTPGGNGKGNNGNGNGKGNGTGNGNGNGKGDNNGGGKGDNNGNSGKGDGTGNGPGAQGGGNNGQPSGTNAIATGTMNIRTSADPSAKVVGWIGRGGYFKIVAQGNSPGGFLWYQIQTKSGKSGWVYSRWVQPTNN